MLCFFAVKGVSHKCLNEIYARYGYTFSKNPDNQTQRYFNSKNWYQGTRGSAKDFNLEDVDTDIERYNLIAISYYERMRTLEGKYIDQDLARNHVLTWEKELYQEDGSYRYPGVMEIIEQQNYPMHYIDDF